MKHRAGFVARARRGVAPAIVMLGLLVGPFGCDEEAMDDPTAGSAGSAGPDSGASGLEMCAGSYTGSFTGDDMGLATAELEADGTLTLTFTTSVGPANAEGTVTEAGDISGSQDGTTVVGTLDFSGCSMSGTWETTGFGGGDWTAQKD